MLVQEATAAPMLNCYWKTSTSLLEMEKISASVGTRVERKYAYVVSHAKCFHIIIPSIFLNASVNETSGPNPAVELNRVSLSILSIFMIEVREQSVCIRG